MLNAQNAVFRVGEPLALSSDGNETLFKVQNQKGNVVITNPYRVSSAVAYARIYSANNSTTGNANDKFHNNGSNDCANFVSQCIWAGFGGDNTKASKNVNTYVNEYPYDNTGSIIGEVNSSNRVYTLWTPAVRTWNGALSLYAYAEDNTDLDSPGWIASTYSAQQDSNQKYTVFPSGVDYTGSAFFVQGSSETYGHVIFINYAVGNQASNMYYCAHSMGANNANLALNASYIANPIRVAKPIAYKISANCTGNYTTHTYSGVSSGNGYDASCNRCGYKNMYFNMNWARYGTNSSVAIFAQEIRENLCYHISATIYNSTGVVDSFEVTNSSSISAISYNMTAAGLYRVVISATDKNAGSDVTTKTYEYSIRVS